MKETLRLPDSFRFTLFLLTAFIMLAVIPSCVPFLNQPLETRRARLGPETPQNKELSSLPAPKEKIVAAVYKFRDQTGQYKPSEMGANWSTAITQGTTAILLRALEESNWFIAIERENIGNLLNERKIIRSSRAQYAGEDEGNNLNLPPLLFAGVLLEGGIISYETNILTGGMGLRYFGTGGSGQYREDMVTVYLRAISTSSGKILKTVYTSKSILSQQVEVGVFRYVKFKRLLEAETGFTYNEPSEMAVTEAIEKAVTALIIEGQKDGYWQYANAADSTSAVVQNYFSEKVNNEDTDLFGRLLTATYRGKAYVYGAGGINRFDADYPGAEIRTCAKAGAGYMFTPSLGVELRVDGYNLNSGPNFETDAFMTSACMRYLFHPMVKLTPFVEVGIGLIDETGNNNYNPFKGIGTAFYGIGVEYLLSPRMGINASANHVILFNDKFDKVEQGKYNDMVWSSWLGLNFYFGKQKVKKVPMKQNGN